MIADAYCSGVDGFSTIISIFARLDVMLRSGLLTSLSGLTPYWLLPSD